MKVIIVHGDHIEQSYERLSKFIQVAKKRGWKVERLSGKDTENLPEVMSANTLFNEERLFIVEDVSKTPIKQLEWIKKRSKDLPGTLVFFEEDHLTKAALNKLPKPDKIELYKLPKLIYKFLESFYPRNAKECLRFLASLKNRHAPEYILAVVAGHLRDVYIARLDAKKLNYPSWRTTKLKGQARKFTENTLKKTISSLSEIDFLSKTTPQSIYDSLDLLIATQLE
jgi:DNA polymerase III delta subunit